MKFPVTIHLGEDGYYVSECPVIPGCLSQGKTEKEALENIKEAIELCVKPPPPTLTLRGGSFLVH